METITVDDMWIDVRTEDAIMFEPVGAGIKVPQCLRFGVDIYYLLSLNHDGRACYSLR